MMTLIGGLVGALFCLYSVLFRWKALVSKYGRRELYFWLLAMTSACSLLGYFADVALWATRYSVWGAEK
jgi:hypothetical protein